MDQIRKALTWLKAYHFWVLCVLIVCVSLVCWYLSTSVLAKEFKEHQSLIQQAFSTAQQVSGQPFHANAEINEKQTAEIQKRGAAVLDTWKVLYDRQRAQVLKWPAELGPDFSVAMDKLKFGDEISTSLLDVYRNYSLIYFPNLPKIVNAPVLEDTAAGGGRAGSDIPRPHWRSRSSWRRWDSWWNRFSCRL